MATHPVQQPSWIDDAPIRVTATVDISAPPDRVWPHIADHASWPTWFEALDRIEPLGAPTGVGGGRRAVAGKLSFDEQFTVWDENEHFAFAVVKSGLPILHTMIESVRLEPYESGTRVTYRQGLSGRPGFGWAMRLAWKRGGSSVQPALDNLRRLIENEENR
jgi:hypothetical protein